MTTGIAELDEQIAFWAMRPESIEHAVATAFFAGMTLGAKLARGRPPVAVPTHAHKTKRDKDVDQSADCVLHTK